MTIGVTDRLGIDKDELTIVLAIGLINFAEVPERSSQSGYNMTERGLIE